LSWPFRFAKLRFVKKLFLVCLASFALSAFAETKFTRTEDVIYGRKFAMSLTMDIFQPEKPNGCGVIMVVSGGWFSAKEAIAPAVYDPFLQRGYTVFAVLHGSQPKFQIPEVMQDMHRAVRFIRTNAKKYGVDPNHLGVTGGSAGGHLSLVLGTQGRKGDEKSKDPVDKESSAVQAVACFFPPTDFLNYGKTGESALGENILAAFKPAFGDVPKEAAAKEKFGREISPIYSVTSNLPPTFILHGDADKLVPIQQAETFVKKAEEAGAKAKLVVKKDGGHGWADWMKDFALFADWFDEHLRGIKPVKP
jgi:acetyl esterase/lipase